MVFSLWPLAIGFFRGFELMANGQWRSFPMSDVFWHFSDEEGGLFAEAVGGLGGIVADSAAFAESGVHIGVAAEVVAQAGGYVFAL